MSNLNIDFTFLWAWVLLFTRMTGMFHSLPGIGTDQVPESFRSLPAIMLAICAVLGGVRADMPDTMAQGAVMVGSEFALGWVFGFVPALTLSGLAVAGQIISGSIGLAQANMIDQSLGESVSIFSRIQLQIATLIFLFMGGHHIVIAATSGVAQDIGVGMFRPDADTFAILLHRFTNSFELALVVSSPIIVASLLTQFVLGLVTKFVPQVNVFLISMPLSVLAGMYIIVATLYGLAEHSYIDLRNLEETLSRIALASSR
jgi:flagellar biosynthetic protein FliR